MCILSASCRPHFRSGPVASWPTSAWRCPRHGLPCLLFHYALGCHQRGQEQELRCAYTRALLNVVLFHSFLIADTTRASIGAGSVPSTRAYALVVNTSGCGSHYLLRQYYIYHYISGRKVVCLLMKRGGTSFTCRTPIRGLNTHSGELHWECFCKLAPLEL
jgi:hypothetical protein